MEDKLNVFIFITAFVASIWAMSQIVQAAELTHRWKSPSFSGIGTSAHFLTIENQEFTRKAEIKAKKEKILTAEAYQEVRYQLENMIQKLHLGYGG